MAVAAAHQSPDSRKVAYSTGFSEESFNEWVIYRCTKKVKQ